MEQRGVKSNYFREDLAIFNRTLLNDLQKLFITKGNHPL